jgi:hypothetical protein
MWTLPTTDIDFTAPQRCPKRQAYFHACAYPTGAKSLLLAVCRIKARAVLVNREYQTPPNQADLLRLHICTFGKFRVRNFHMKWTCQARRVISEHLVQFLSVGAEGNPGKTLPSPAQDAEAADRSWSTVPSKRACEYLE